MLKREPVVVIATAAAAILAVFGVVIDADAVVTVVMAVAPIVISLLQRAKVIPVAKVQETSPAQTSTLV